jgi:transketolase
VRNAFIDELCLAAEKDPSIWLLTADLGFSVLESFIEKFPNRYLNVGVAEQNMMGVAAGLALSGKRVFAYSIVNFATLRCFEQIRNDIVYHGANVTIVGVGGGFAYGAQGYTHHGLEDLAVMRTLGEIDVAAPADAFETRCVVRTSLSHERPAYIRLAKAGEEPVHNAVPNECRGKPISILEGTDALIVATGCLVQEAVAAGRLLADKGINTAVWSCPWLSPFDNEMLLSAVRSYPLVLTAEEGVTGGGLGAQFNQISASLSGSRARVLNAGVPHNMKHVVAKREIILQEIKLDAAGLAGRIELALDE